MTPTGLLAKLFLYFYIPRLPPCSPFQCRCGAKQAGLRFWDALQTSATEVEALKVQIAELESHLQRSSQEAAVLKQAQETSVARTVEQEGTIAELQKSVEGAQREAAQKGAEGDDGKEEFAAHEATARAALEEHSMELEEVEARMRDREAKVAEQAAQLDGRVQRVEEGEAHLKSQNADVERWDFEALS